MISSEHIEIVNNYTLYVGVKFSVNGYFTNHKENSTEKTEVLNLWLGSRSFVRVILSCIGDPM